MKRIGVLLLVVGWLIASSAVSAVAAGPPSAVLMAGEESQEGSIKAYCWNDAPIIQTCLRQNFYAFPKSLLEVEGPASIVFKKPEPPEVVTIRYWTRIHRVDAGSAWFDRPRGRARTIDSDLEPIVTGEGLQWQATFEPPDEKPIYLAVKAEWRVEALCPGCDQWVTWAFSLR